MINLNTLTNAFRPKKARKRCGRGLGSKIGKTCGRGEKGAGSRAGYKRRFGKEGGNMPLYMKLPIRGFSNARFQKKYDVVNLAQIDAAYSDKEVVNIETLKSHGFISGRTHGIKILARGELTKKIASFEVHALSEGAREKLQKAKIPVTILE